jgi:hypothetical protein
MASDKITASWLFGTFRNSGFDAKAKKSVKWHVRFNYYITWCGLRLERVDIRDWRSGPPDGPICVICDRYFAREIGLGAARTSLLVSQERAGS